MTNNALEIENYSFKPDDKLFLDANIWLFVYGPQDPSDRRVEIYSHALARILAVRSRLFIDALVVSEFINTYARLKWRIVAPQIKKFKEFRKKGEFKAVAEDIAADIRRVLDLCSWIESGFLMPDVHRLIDEYASGDFDFNDQVIASICRRNGFKLVTDDSDFKGKGIQVVTANSRLLR